MRHNRLTSRTGIFAAVSALLLGAGTAQADSHDDFWTEVSDRLYDVLVEFAPGEVLTQLFDPETTGLTEAYVPLSDTGSETLSVDILDYGEEGVELQLFLAGIDTVPAAYLLDFTSETDLVLPGMRGSLTDCYEDVEFNCARLPLMRRSDFTLGVAVCLCTSGITIVDVDGSPAAVVGCYLGESATDLDLAFGYGPLDSETAAFLDNADEDELGAICEASTAGQAYPEFLWRSEDASPPVSFPEGLDPDAQMRFLAATDHPDLGPLDLLTYLRR